MSTSDETPPRVTALTRELLEGDALRDAFSHAVEPGMLWTDEQIESSLATTIQGREVSEFWIFAYGSLIWNPIFPVARRLPARIHGYHRAFCLSSPFGRGTSDRPGLVLGLAAGGSCNGVAFRIGGGDIHTDLRLLWRREMLVGSYMPRWVKAYGSQGQLSALAFVASWLARPARLASPELANCWPCSLPNRSNSLKHQIRRYPVPVVVAACISSRYSDADASLVDPRRHRRQPGCPRRDPARPAILASRCIIAAAAGSACPLDARPVDRHHLGQPDGRSSC
jgi:cation transport protein ChaC